MKAVCKKRNIDIGIENLQEFGVTQCARMADGADGPRGRAPRDCGCAACPRAPATTAWRSRAIADIAMLFVRCKGGISHNPAESISAQDAAAGARVLSRFIEGFRAISA